jgi:hypothetical protein
MLFIAVCGLCQADELKIPFTCYPIQLQSEFSTEGYKLDLSGNERTPDSWGFVENRGNEYSIVTYSSVTEKDFEVVKKVTSEVELWQRRQ